MKRKNPIDGGEKNVAPCEIRECEQIKMSIYGIDWDEESFQMELFACIQKCNVCVCVSVRERQLEHVTMRWTKVHDNLEVEQRTFSINNCGTTQNT